MAVFKFVILVSIVETIFGCGIITHTEIGHRATKYFKDTGDTINYKQLILDHQDAFQAGNPYPDAYYDSICSGGKYHGVSEDTHWAPFIKTTIQYIRDKYPQPWDKETEKLVVFLLGFASHQVADVSWHSLGIDQGFLTTMGDINFFGSFPAAHSVGDEGGDVLSVGELNLEYIAVLSDWYIPVNDLYEIYKQYYNGTINIEKNIIIECTSLLFLARLGEKLAFSKLYRDYSSKSPFMVEEFESYFLGGVDDMALQTDILWHKTILMLEQGTSVCNIPHNPIYINCSGTARTRPDQPSGWDTSQRGLRSKVDLRGLSSSDVVVKAMERGVFLSPSDSIKSELKSLGREIQQKGNSKNVSSRAEAKQPPSELYVNNAYARLGGAMTTGHVTGSPDEDLIVRAPGYGSDGCPQLGRVYVVKGDQVLRKNGSRLNLDMDSEIILQGFHEGGKFGSGVATLDLNLDGFVDVAVSAPSVGSKNLTYQGEVYVFFGNQAGNISTTPNITITCTLKYCNLGWTLSAGDFDLDGHPDLLIGSPFAPVNNLQQAGMMSVLYAGSNFRNINKVKLTEKDMNYTFTGDQEYGWFGHSVSLRTKPGLDPLLLLSQPTYRICANPDCSYSPKDIQSVGSLTVYKGGSYSTPALVLKGQESFGKLGAAMAMGNPFGNGSVVLAVSANTENVKGRIAEVSTTFTQAGCVDLSFINSNTAKPHPPVNHHDDSIHRGYYDNSLSLDPVAKYEGDRSYGRFGGEVMFADVTGDGIDDFIVAAPFRTVDITEEIFKVEEGAVYVYEGGPSFHTGNVTNQCRLLAGVKPCPQHKAYAVLSTGEGGSRFGSKLTIWKYNKKTHLVVSAPRSNANERLAGALYIYAL